MTAAGPKQISFCVDPKEQADIEEEIRRCGGSFPQFLTRLVLHSNGSKAAYIDSLKDMHADVRRAIGRNGCEKFNKPGVDLIYRTECYAKALDQAEQDADLVQGVFYENPENTGELLLSQLKEKRNFMASILESACSDHPTETCFENNLSALHQELIDAYNEMQASFDELARFSVIKAACGTLCQGHSWPMETFVPKDAEAIRYEPLRPLPGKAPVLALPARIEPPSERIYHSSKEPRGLRQYANKRGSGKKSGGAPGTEKKGQVPACLVDAEAALTDECKKRDFCASSPEVAQSLKIRLCNPELDWVCTLDPEAVTDALPLCAPHDPNGDYCTFNPAAVTESLPLCPSKTPRHKKSVSHGGGSPGGTEKDGGTGGQDKKDQETGGKGHRTADIFKAPGAKVSKTGAVGGSPDDDHDKAEKQDDNEVDCSEGAVAQYEADLKGGAPDDEFHRVLYIETQQKRYFCRVNLLYSQDLSAIFLSRFGFRAIRLGKNLLASVAEHPFDHKPFCEEFKKEYGYFLKDVRILKTVSPSSELARLEADFDAALLKMQPPVPPGASKKAIARAQEEACDNVYGQFADTLHTWTDPPVIRNLTKDLCSWRKKAEGYDPDHGVTARTGSTRCFPRDLNDCPGVSDCPSLNY